MPDSPAPPPSPFRWPIRLLAVLLAGVFFYRFFVEGVGELQGQSAQATQLPRIKVVPPFILTERSGRTITNQDLQGKIWVADFVYTTCPGPCPLVTASMARVQAAIANDPHVQLVTFTVDPQNDTPSVLADYAKKYDADPDRWWFLTGPEKPLYELIVNGFYQTVQDNRGKPLEPGELTITHSTWFVLIDASGIMRASYDGINPDGRADLLKGIKTLEKEENP